MTEFLLALVVFVLAITGMSVGVIIRNKSIKGSCGGLANLRDEHGRSMCEACTKPSPECTGADAESKSDVSARELEETTAK